MSKKRFRRETGKSGDAKIHEHGAIRKKWKGRVPVAVVFPESYGVGMANLGFQVVYSLLNNHDFIVAERFFMSSGESDTASPPRSVESNRSLDEFAVILFSISFETSYINVIRMLHISGLPVGAERFTEETPMVIAGGVATQINPEPLAPFVDAFLLGDFEKIAPGLIRFIEDGAFLFSNMRERGDAVKKLASMVPGVYLPAFYAPVYDADGLLNGWEVQDSMPFPVPVARFTGQPDIAPHTVVTSPASAFPDMCNIELVRGCGRGCRFCAAGFIYRPPRPWSKEAIRMAVEEGMAETGRAGLVGLEFTAAEELSDLCGFFVDSGIHVSFSSIRIDALTDEFVQLLKESGTKTATIAPEAGSERMRLAINKNLTEEQIIEGVTKLASSGIPNLKLYFMTGLPGEEMEDVEAIVSLSDRIYARFLEAGRRRGRVGTVTVSVNSFVPKAWTPMQWAGFEIGPACMEKRRFLKKEIGKRPNFRIRMDFHENTLIQAVLSRGDRRLAPVLQDMALNETPLKHALVKAGLDLNDYIRIRSVDEVFPWEIVGHPVLKKYLMEEWRRASEANATSFCRTDICRRCGACAGEDNSNQGKPGRE